MNKRTLLIPGAVLLVLIIAYLALSAHATSQAEKGLEDWLYDNKLEGMLRWDSISASVFGGSYTLRGVTITGKDQLRGLDLDVDAIKVADLADERDRKSISLALHGIRPAGQERGAAAALYELLHESGRQELEPFDLSLSARYDAEQKQANFSFSLDVPQLLAGEGSLQLNNARDLDRELENLGTSAVQLSLFSPMALFGLGRLVEDLPGVELGDASFSLRDQGYFKRRDALHQRYAYSLEPGKGDADKQRTRLAENEQRQWQQQCLKTWERAYEDAEDACEAWWKAQHGQSKGLRVRIEPQSRVRLSDLGEIAGNPQRAERSLARLNLSVDSL